MACFACHGCVPTLKPVTGFGMIELFDRDVPMDQIEIVPVVFDMTSGATPF